ncbi:MAG: SDR family oxidoreductase [Chloroflexi bacterium]|jgi:NAD(P)-dependent dehydrogenase (short-subunit alcohol dehydrogenase family)|nr:SDR family oxidoreductase [Chloroflexota bacterium]
MFDIDLSGKRALVTGGAAGIGRACVETLAKAGAQVAIVDINLPGAQEAAAAVGGLALRCDLGDPDDTVAMCKTLTDELGGIDILVNNAGLIVYQQGIAGVSVDMWDKIMNVNLRGPFVVCRELMPGMKERGYGKIINFSSMAARVGGIEASLQYSVSKAGLIGMTKTLAKEGGPYGVNVNAVAPGVIATAPVVKQVGDHEDSYTQGIPLRRLGQPQDVANVVLFLASPLSDYITGLVIDINGGMYMG